MIASNGFDNIQSQTWLDSQSIHHLTLYATQVFNSTPFICNEGITIGDVNEISICSVGYRALHTNDTCFLELNNVLHAPQFLLISYLDKNYVIIIKD